MATVDASSVSKVIINDHLVNLTQASIPEIDLSQSPVHEIENRSKPIDIPYLSPPRFGEIIPSNMSCRSFAKEQSSKMTATYTLEPPPRYWNPNFSNGIIIINEAKSIRDPDFELLWGHREEIQLFAGTAGGRTTHLRTLSPK